MRIGVGILLFGYSRSHLGMSKQKFLHITCQCAEIALNGFVGTVNRGVELRIGYIHPILLILPTALSESKKAYGKSCGAYHE